MFWVGEDLTPWLEGAIETLSDDASVTALLAAEGTIVHDFREDALFEAHDHDDHDDHGHEEHADDHGQHHDHKEANADGHDDHDHEEHSAAKHDDHAHGEHDPHAWLSPQNAANWLNVIAVQLSAADPDKAGTYFANAATARTEMDALSVEVNGLLDPVRGKSFVAFHNAYQYFEVDLNFPAAGAISLSDAADPSPARVAEIQSRVRD